LRYALGGGLLGDRSACLARRSQILHLVEVGSCTRIVGGFCPFAALRPLRDMAPKSETPALVTPGLGETIMRWAR
jgi:hypothetical protein